MIRSFKCTRCKIFSRDVILLWPDRAIISKTHEDQNQLADSLLKELNKENMVPMKHLHNGKPGAESDTNSNPVVIDDVDVMFGESPDDERTRETKRRKP